MEPTLIEGELFLAKDFAAPPSLDYNGYHDYIDTNLPAESPELYGLHSNTEIGVLTTASELLFRTLFELQPKIHETGTSDAPSREDIILNLIDDISEKIPVEFSVREMMARDESPTPYTIVVFQECDRMNILMQEIKRSLKELLAGN